MVDTKYTTKELWFVADSVLDTIMSSLKIFHVKSWNVQSPCPCQVLKFSLLAYPCFLSQLSVMCKLFPCNIDYRIVLNYMMFNSSLENCGGFFCLSKLWCFLLSFHSWGGFACFLWLSSFWLHSIMNSISRYSLMIWSLYVAVISRMDTTSAGDVEHEEIWGYCI